MLAAVRQVPQNVQAAQGHDADEARQRWIGGGLLTVQETSP